MSCFIRNSLTFLSFTKRRTLSFHSQNIKLICVNCNRFNRNFSSSAVKRKSGYSAMNIFDRQAKILQRERAALNPDYQVSEYIKEEIGWRIADRVFDIKRTFYNAVDLGCSRGYVSRHFTPDSVEHVTLCDTNQTLLNQAIVGEGVKSTKLVMDEENLDLPPDSVDLMVSSLALHWVNDLPGCFDRIMKCLKPDGVFIACVFGGDTLYELRQSLQLAEMERLGGLAPHISPFTRIRDIGGLLTSSGFTMQTVDSDEIVIWYPSMWELLDDIRGMGESGAALNRPLRVAKDTLFAAAAVYDEMHGKYFPEKSSRGIPATYQIIHFLGWKPDPSQPKPLARGSGEFSLKDLHKLDSIVKDTKKIDLGPDDKNN